MEFKTKRLATLAKAPTSEGTFDGLIDFNPPEGDSDGERVAEFTNLPGAFPLSYQHSLHGDPGAVIGTGLAELQDEQFMAVSGALDLSNKMAEAVHERMLLPDSDELALKELSIGFAFDPSKVTQDDNGVFAIHDAELIEISVVWRGAQSTTVTNVKALKVLAEDVKTGLITLDQALTLAVDAKDEGLDADIALAMFRTLMMDGAHAEALAMDAARDKEMDDVKDTQTKPWHIEERDGKFCVILDEDGSTVKCHDTLEEAQAHLAALYANVPEAGKDSQLSADGDAPADADSQLSEGKAGRVLSKANETKLRDAADAMKAAAEAIESVLSTVAEQQAEAEAEAKAEAAAKIEAEAAVKAEVDRLKAEAEAEIEGVESKIADLQTRIDALGL